MEEMFMDRIKKLMKEYKFELVEDDVEIFIFEKEYKGALNLWYTDRIIFNRTYKVVTFTIDSVVGSMNMEELKLIYIVCNYLGWLKEGE